LVTELHAIAQLECVVPNGDIVAMVMLTVVTVVEQDLVGQVEEDLILFNRVVHIVDDVLIIM
jgi:hypothetical protein